MGMNGNGQSQPADLHVQEVIRSAERELHELLERRAELMKRIGTIKQTVAGLANIFGGSVLSEELLTVIDRKSASRQPGFTRACRLVLMGASSRWERGRFAMHCCKNSPTYWGGTKIRWRR